MDALLLNVISLFLAAWGILVALMGLLAPWTPLLAWMAVWLFAVNWTKLREIIFHDGGLVGVVLLALVAILLWGLIAPPAEGSHYLFGLKVSNFVGKTVYVSSLVVIMFLCGSVQLSGACDPWIDFSEPEPQFAHHDGHDGHGHGDHGHDSHSHDSHGHGDHGHGHGHH